MTAAALEELRARLEASVRATESDPDGHTGILLGSLQAAVGNFLDEVAGGAQ